MKAICTLTLLIFSFLSFGQEAYEADFKKMAWLLGTWEGEANGQPFYEDWRQVSATEFANVNFALCNGDTVAGGHSKIEIRNNKITVRSFSANADVLELTGLERGAYLLKLHGTKGERLVKVVKL